MPFVDDRKRTINFKIIYAGPNGAGKATTVRHLHETIRSVSKSDLVSWDTGSGCALSFAFEALSPGHLEFQRCFHLHALSGPACTATARRKLLVDVDGVVFVADLQRARSAENVEVLAELASDLTSYGFDIHRFPLTMQYNKRDLADALPAAELDTLFAPVQCPRFTTSAKAGDRVVMPLMALVEQLVEPLRHSG